MIKKISLLGIFCLAIVSCKKNDSSPVKKNDTEEETIVENVVNDNKSLSSLTSKRYGNDLIEEIYQEILNNDKDLTKLDNRIKNLNESTNNVIKEYNTVLSKSNTFYTLALSKTASFSDSLYSKKIDSLIHNSKNAYSAKTLPLTSIIDSAKANQNRINDLYTAFKIKKTLTEIETYQNTNAFDLTNINKAIKEQTELVKEIKTVNAK